MNPQRARALGEAFFLRACKGNITGAEFERAKHVRYLLTCHCMHYDLHGVGDIFAPGMQDERPGRSTRDHLRELAQLARASRSIIRRERRAQ